MVPYSLPHDEANRARYLAEDQVRNARSRASASASQASKEEQARKTAQSNLAAAESKIAHLKNVLGLVRQYHVHSFPSAASSAAGLCCEFCRQIDEAISL